MHPTSCGLRNERLRRSSAALHAMRGYACGPGSRRLPSSSRKLVSLALTRSPTNGASTEGRTLSSARRQRWSATTCVTSIPRLQRARAHVSICRKARSRRASPRYRRALKNRHRLSDEHAHDGPGSCYRCRIGATLGSLKARSGRLHGQMMSGPTLITSAKMLRSQNDEPRHR
jgi:hypothetical protein